MALINGSRFGGKSYIHDACLYGRVDLVRALVQKHGVGILKHKDSDGDTPLHVLAIKDQHEVAVMLANEFGSSVKGHKGRSLLHIACEEGNISLVRILVLDHKADVTARDGEGNTPLHVAAMNGSGDVVVALIKEFGCDVHAKGHIGWSLLHSACASDNGRLVSLVSEHVSPWVLDDNGDTPLHICARLGNSDCVQALLELDPPVLLRNNSGKTSKDVAKNESYKCVEDYMRDNRGKIYSHYEVILKHAKRSTPLLSLSLEHLL